MRIVRSSILLLAVLASSCSDPETGEPVPVPKEPTYEQLEAALAYNQSFLNHPDPTVVKNAEKNIKQICKAKQGMEAELGRSFPRHAGPI